MVKKHLAIFKGSGGELILNGIKTIEARFSKSKIAPFGVVSPGDLVYIKPAGKDIIGQFRVQKVFSFEGLEMGDISQINDIYGVEIAKNAKVATLIFIEKTVRFLTSPLKVSKKDLRGWAVLD